MVGGRPRHGDAPRVVRHLPRLPGRPPTHLPATHLRRHRLPRRHAVLLDGPITHPRPAAGRDLAAGRSARGTHGSGRPRRPTRPALPRANGSSWSAAGRSGCSSRWSPARPAARCWSSRSTPTDGRSSPSLGFDVLDPTTDDVAAHLEAWTEGAGVPLAFEVSGSQPGLDTADRCPRRPRPARRRRHPPSGPPGQPVPALLA